MPVGSVLGTERRIFYASQLGEGLVIELDGPSLDAFILGPKEGRYATKYLDTSSHNWHFRHFHPRFRFLKGAVKRAEQEGHVEEELVEQSLAGPLIGEEWLLAVIFLFDSTLMLSRYSAWSFLNGTGFLQAHAMYQGI